jgi:hypothetical protein
MTTTGIARVVGTDRTQRFRTACLALAVISFVKYASIAVRSFADAPHFFLVFLVLPFVVSALLVPRAPRAGAIVFLLFGGLYTWLMLLQLVNGVEDDYWGDYLLVYVGGPVAVAGLVLAVPVLRAARPSRS